MTKELEAAIAKAIEICLQEVALRTKIMFELGAVVNSIPHVYRGNCPQWGRTPKKRVVSLLDAINTVKAGLLEAGKLHGFSVPTSDAYWYSAVNAHKVWTQAERDILIKHRVAWADVYTLQNLPNHGKKIIADIAEGRNNGHNLQNRLRAKRGTKAGSKHRQGLAGDRAITEFAVRGDETQDEIQGMIESLLSAALRCGHNVDEIVTAALARVRRLARAR